MGEDGVADLVMLNYKCADFVGHKYGPESEELHVTLRDLARSRQERSGQLRDSLADHRARRAEQINGTRQQFRIFYC